MSRYQRGGAVHCGLTGVSTQAAATNAATAPAAAAAADVPQPKLGALKWVS